nr:MAG TPA: hypothetical protein [Caudoviricetes sp.]
MGLNINTPFSKQIAMDSILIKLFQKKLQLLLKICFYTMEKNS